MKGSSETDIPPLPKTFVLELTHRCNHACRYCYATWRAQGSAGTSPTPDSRGENSTAEIREIIKRLQAQAPVESIALSGGEPLLREDLIEIVSFIRGRGIAPVIITNGTLLTEDFIDSTRDETTYEVTLLSHRAEVHDQMAGTVGAWGRAVEGMAKIRQKRGRLVSVFIASRLNYMDLLEAAELSIALGADGLMYNRVNLGAHNMQQADQLLPTPEMIEENLDMLDHLQKKYGLTVAVSVVIEPCVVDVRKYSNIHFGWCPLAGKDAYFTIDPVGNIRICNHSPTVLGNIMRDRFTDIYYHHSYVQQFRDTLPDECTDCEPSLKEMCRGGCKAAAEQCYGTLTRVDPFVTMSQRVAR